VTYEDGDRGNPEDLVGLCQGGYGEFGLSHEDAQEVLLQYTRFL